MDLGAHHRRPGVRFGVRLGLQDVAGIDDHQIKSLLTGQKFDSVGDVRRRAALSAPVAEALAHAGAFDEIGGVDAGVRSRRDVLLEVSERWSGLRRHQPAAPEAAEQLSLLEPGPPGLAGYRPSDRVRAELEVLGMETSRHVVTFYDDLLDVLGVTRTVDLLRLRNGQRVRVAGVKVATQTPPVKSGQRIIFLSLDDATGVSDATFFESVHDRCAWTVFHTWLLVVEGTVHRTGARGVSVNADAVWDLRRLMGAWRDGVLAEALAGRGGPAAPAPGPVPSTGPQPPDVFRSTPGEEVTGLPAGDRHPSDSRRVVAELRRARGEPDPGQVNGTPLDRLRSHPGRDSRIGPNGTTWADPARRHPGVDSLDVARLPEGHPQHPGNVPAKDEGRPAPPRKLWHASGGSAGR
jgi:error-prone DNA polymerase